MTDLHNSAAAVAGADNLGRLRRRLARSAPAMSALRALGVTERIADRFDLGLKEPYRSRRDQMLVEDAVAFPVMARGGGPTGRYAYWPLEGVTLNAVHPAGWGPGDPLPYFGGAATGSEELVVVSDPLTLWLLSDRFAGAGRPITVMTRSHPRDIPFGWTTDAFWEGWKRVVLALDGDDRSCQVAQSIQTSARREVHVAGAPHGQTWMELIRAGASVQELLSIIDRAGVVERPEGPELGDDLDVRPVAPMGAWLGGHMHYAFRVERRSAHPGSVTTDVLTQYATLVLRSDGDILEAAELPAPPGTPKHSRVCALSDGTRIDGLPVAGPACSWSPASIRAFVDARRSGSFATRPLARILADVELYLRSVAWLPDPDSFAIAAAFIVMTHCHRLFPALPMLLINGGHGTGKSELGQGLADLSFNGMVVGQVTAAALVRLAQEARGLIVLDDLERISGRLGGVGDVSQLLKVAYKQSTARRVIADASGGTRTVDLFGPRCITNIGGADAVLASRMLQVRTAKVPSGQLSTLAGPDLDRSTALRDELHTWTFGNAGQVEDAFSRQARERTVRDRSAEILMPLMAIAHVAGEDWPERVTRAAARSAQGVPDAGAILAQALRAIRKWGGGAEVSIAQIALQCAVEAGPNGCPDLLGTPEALGRYLASTDLRDRSQAATRARLHGRVTRIYKLSESFLTANPGVESDDRKNKSSATPFAFCTEMACSECGYDAVCDSAAPGLRDAKKARFGCRPS